jgi:hypothetical protein
MRWKITQGSPLGTDERARRNDADYDDEKNGMNNPRATPDAVLRVVYFSE